MSPARFNPVLIPRVGDAGRGVLFTIELEWESDTLEMDLEP